MKILSSLAQTVATKTLGSSKLVLAALAVCALSSGLAATSQAAPITGDPQGNGFGWVAPSTNALNYQSLAPGHEGQDNPYVLFASNAVGSVTLDFYNLAPGLAFFEIRYDGVAAGSTAHPVVIGDTIHSGNAVSTGTTELGMTYYATNYVDVRLALGGERDWDFDWVRFEVLSVPEPASALLFGSTMLGLMGLAGRKKTRS
ncbi:MAG TPA: PEP-CTERM sorting domain-containing protein [Terrimesophilobacter sp.]|nr:PEP-CTERM sorting domain-containing protein [Terrimesophilobacter sp.]